ncbi:MAG: nucleotidyltransferase family protein [Spirochaetes bacterium]|nr:nucleotidyltransferase family protein [Spirochaetota bacterium]
MLTKEEIKNKLKQNVNILKKYNVNRIGIFGSYVKGNFTEKSDVDLLLGFSNTISLLQYVHLSDSISSFLKHDVDLVTINGIKPLLKDSILKEVEWIEGL